MAKQSAVPARAHRGHSGRRVRRGESRLPRRSPSSSRPVCTALLPRRCVRSATAHPGAGAGAAGGAALLIRPPPAQPRDPGVPAGCRWCCRWWWPPPTWWRWACWSPTWCSSTHAGRDAAGRGVAGLGDQRHRVALLFWEPRPGGGPGGARANGPRPDLQLADFRFTHDEDHDAVDEVRGRIQTGPPTGSPPSSTTSTSRRPTLSAFSPDRTPNAAEQPRGRS